jgi:predicted nuclease with RNAse H fold
MGKTRGMAPRARTTAGIDLSASPKTTAICRIRWTGTSAQAEIEASHGTDARIAETIQSAERTGIDAPFGWPAQFVAAVTAHAKGRAWLGRGKSPEEFRRTLRLRRTDEIVAETGITPLSVSTEKLGVTAMRCALALDAAQQAGTPIDRSGVSGSVCEVYPAAALKAWGIDRTGYKRADNQDARRRILRSLRTRFPGLVVDAKDVVATDHALDALLCALVARAVLDRGTDRPSTAGDLELARIEGWIHVPRRDWPPKPN